jgi:type II secretory pathway component GspD/PulD (secretin)
LPPTPPLAYLFLVRPMRAQLVFVAIGAAGIAVITAVAQDSAQTASPPKLPSPPPARSFSTQCQSVDVCDLVAQYGSLTHFKIVRDNFVSGKVSIDDLSGFEREKRIQMIERSLFANGYAIVQVDPDTVEIVGTGKNARTEGIPVIGEPNALPNHERVVSYVFRFKYRSAVEVQQQLGQYLSPPKPYTSFLAEAKSNTLIITERTSVIRRLLEIVAKLDVPDWQKKT